MHFKGKNLIVVMWFHNCLFGTELCPNLFHMSH